MPVLASILPGLRDVRTPLAIGYLWMLNLWLLWPAVPPLELRDRVVERLNAASELVGSPASLVLGLGILAYALGIALQNATEALLGAIHVFVLLYFVILIGIIISSWEVLLPLTAVFAGAYLLSYVRDPRRRIHPQYTAQIRALALELFEGIARVGAVVFNYEAVQQRHARRRFLAHLADRNLGRRHSTLSRMCASVPSEDLARILRQILSEKSSDTPLRDPLGRTWSRREVEIAARAAERGLYGHDLRSLLLESLRESDEVREIVYANYLEHSHLERLLADEVESLPARLRAANPSLYDSWDQIIAEAEFRRGIAAPVAALGFSFWVTLYPSGPLDLRNGGGDGAFLAMLLTMSLGLALTFAFQGTGKKGQAYSTLLGYLRDGTMPLAHRELTQMSDLRPSLRYRSVIRQDLRLLLPR